MTRIELSQTDTGLRSAPGIHTGVSYREYAKWDAANHSKLKHFHRSPLHAKHAIENPRDETESLLLGHALHVATFEPQRFTDEFCIVPQCNFATTEGKLALRLAISELICRKLTDAENKLKKDDLLGLGRREARKSILDAGQFETIRDMGRAIAGSTAAAHYVNVPGDCEVSCIWNDSETGIWCKGRFDKLIPPGPAGLVRIVELKSTRNASMREFGQDCAKLLYHAQADFYLSGHAAVTGAQALHVVIAVENEPPHGVAVYTIPVAALRKGKALWRFWLSRFAECMATGEWPGYPDSVQELEMPHWSRMEA